MDCRSRSGTKSKQIGLRSGRLLPDRWRIQPTRLGVAMIDWIGWIATAVFAVSYFLRRPIALRRTQALAAMLWMSYGIAIKAAPVIVANLIVAALAIISSFQRRDQNAGAEAQVES